MRLTTYWRGLFDILQRSYDHGRRLGRPRVLHLDGLRGPVEILTDRFGVEHVFADHQADLFFAQGYVTARDRLFQMDYNRHAAGGRLCELVGRRKIPWRDLTVHLAEKTTFDVDVLMRSFGMERAAAASLPLVSTAGRAVLAAYAAGVNAYLAGGGRSLEHRLLRLRPRPWGELDSLSMMRAIGFELNFAWRSILLGAQLAAARVPPDVARLLVPHGAEAGGSVIDAADWAAMAKDLTATRAAAAAALGLGNAPGVGSNSIVVSGGRSKHGDALLANDTHLALTAPVPWHEIHLVGDGLDLQGYALTGVPGVAIGRTPHHAWGITAGLVQDLDLFVEKLNPRDPRLYLTPDGWQPLDELCERFTVRGEGEQERVIYVSRHGPLLETVATAPAPGLRFAVAWTGQRPAPDFDGLLGVWNARSPEEFLAASEKIVCPPYNLSYADRDGRIAWVLAGTIPRRRHDTPTRPLEGWTGEWDWQGLVPARENPRLVDPPSGIIVTANNRVAPPGYPYELGELFEASFRFDRMHALLDELGRPIGRDDLAAIQTDCFSQWGVDARAVALDVVGGPAGLGVPEQTREREALDLWLAWDGYADRRSAGAAIGLVTARNIGRELVARLAGDEAAMAWAELAAFTGGTVLELGRMAARLRELGVDPAEVVRTAFARTLLICREAMGEEPAAWNWGALHPLVCRHRLDATMLGPFFAIGPEPADGGPDTVNRGDMGANRLDVKVGPAMRLVLSARDPDAAGCILPGGQSGDRLSPHYDDQLADFLAGRLKPMVSSRARIEVAVREVLLPPGTPAEALPAAARAAQAGHH